MVIDLAIVDDSAAIRKIIQRMLLQVGFTLGTVIEAGDGAEALEKLKGRSVHLILSEINMPNMDGIQLLTQLKSSVELNRIPVVMIATEGGAASVAQAVQLGASGYIRKPFTADQIRDKLNWLL